MIDEVEHARILERAAHDFVVLDAMAVVGQRDDAGLAHRADGREFLPGDPVGDAPVTKTLTHASARAFSWIHVTTLGLSTEGEVFGMQTTLVKPPAAAARAPVAMVSLAPGPARGDGRACRSGRARRRGRCNPALRLRIAARPRPACVTLSEIRPSVIKRSPISSRRFAGSMMRPLRRRSEDIRAVRLGVRLLVSPLLRCARALSGESDGEPER